MKLLLVQNINNPHFDFKKNKKYFSYSDFINIVNYIWACRSVEDRLVRIQDIKSFDLIWKRSRVQFPSG
ncbi:MAG: hypothetical protein ACFFCC_19185, partial [Promethearchaeota archaeon]